MLRYYMEYQLRRQVTTSGLTLMDESLTQPCRVQDEGATRCKLLLTGKKPQDVSWVDGTGGISTG